MAKHSAHPITPEPCPRNRFTINAAFQRFLQLFEGDVETARQHFGAALCRAIRLWYGNKVISRECFEQHLKVHCEIAADQRPTAELWVTKYIDLDGTSDWTVARAEVDDFISRYRQEQQRSPAGARRRYSREDALIEGAGVFAEDGLTTFEAFWVKVKERLGPGGPGDTLLKQILRPLHQRLRNAREP